MLMSIGPFAFDLIVNADGYDEDAAEDFARKDVIGTRRPFEHVGAGDDRQTIRSALLPRHLGGGDALAGLPQFLIRGDGQILGWIVMTSVRAQSNHLDGHGRPGHVAFEVEGMACDQPAAASHFAALLSLGT